MAHVIVAGKKRSVASLSKSELQCVSMQGPARGGPVIPLLHAITESYPKTSLRKRIEILADVHGITTGKPLRVRCSAKDIRAWKREMGR